MCRLSPIGMPTDEELIQGMLEKYQQEFRRCLKVDHVLPTVASTAPEEYPFTANVPLYGPIRNRAGGSTYFDDEPLTMQIAELHAAAFQLAAFFGNVQGYDGPSLASAATWPAGKEPLPSEALERALEDAILHAEVADVRLVGSHRVVGPIRRRIQYPNQKDPPSRLVGLLTAEQVVPIAHAPHDVAMLLRRQSVGRLHVHPEAGTVLFDAPVKEVDSHVVKAVAYHRLEIRHEDGVLAWCPSQARE